MKTTKRTRNDKISINLKEDRIIELQNRLCESNKRDITTEDLAYISKFSKEYINENIEKSIDILKSVGINYSRYITKSEEDYQLFPIGTYMAYLASTQIKDDSIEFETFVNILLLSIQVQMFIDDIIISNLDSFMIKKIK
jgi:hypothetical protein